MVSAVAKGDHLLAPAGGLASPKWVPTRSALGPQVKPPPMPVTQWFRTLGAANNKPVGRPPQSSLSRECKTLKFQEYRQIDTTEMGCSANFMPGIAPRRLPPGPPEVAPGCAARRDMVP
jgi:hypothetical protein